MSAKAVAGCVVMVLFGLTNSLCGQPGEAAEPTVESSILCRLRAGPTIPLDAEGHSHIQIFADHAHWPAGENDCGCLRLTAVTARIALAEGHELISVEIPASLGPADSWYSAMKAVDGGWFLGLFPLDASSAALPEALSRELWTLTIASAPSAGVPTIQLTGAPPGSDEGPRFYLSGGSLVTPAIPNSPSVDFPNPTEAELAVVVEQPEAAVPAEILGPPEMLLGGTDPETPCSATYELGPVPLSSQVEFYIQVPSATAATIQEGVDEAIDELDDQPQNPNARAVVSVAPGVYNESVVIDTQNWLGHLILVSTVGPGPDADTLPASVDLATRIDPLGLGPCILIYGALGTMPPSTGRVTIGWSVTEDLGVTSPFPGADGGANVRGWRGFDLVNGGASSTPPFLQTEALGVAVRGVESAVEFRGCWIHGHSDPNAAAGFDGGGVGITSCADVRVLQCDISDNEAKNSGCGLWASSSTVQVGRCFVHDNTFSTLAATARMLGGGIYSANSRLALCCSFLYANTARLGGGVAVTFSDIPFASIWAEDNAIYENTGAAATNNFFSTPYRGAGIWIGPDPTYSGLFTPVQHSIGLLRNRVRNNNITIPAGSPLGGSPPALNASGGGVFIDVDLADGAGPLIGYPSGFTRNLIIGNAIWRNTAQDLAGGAYLGIWTSSDSVAFESNTFYNNALQNQISGRAADLFIPFSGAPTQLGYVDFTGGNQLVENNNSVFQSRSWFAQCDPNGVTPNPPIFPLSHLDNLFPAGCVSANTSANLRPATSFCTDTDSRLFLRNAGDADELPALGRGSPCIDQGSDWTAGGDSGQSSVFQLDLELDVRPNNEWDPGAEELTLYDFIRGDTSGDGSVNIADVIAILEEQFPSGPPAPIACRDRADTNDDGQVNIADAIHLLEHLFPGGSPPNVIPPPFSCPPGGGPSFCCGQDPTMDTIEPCDVDYNGTCP